jgi:hypothetical protein
MLPSRTPLNPFPLMPVQPLPLLLPAVDLFDVEQATEQAGTDLEQALLPLFLYCEKTQGRPELSEYQFRHLSLIRAALDAVAAYSMQVEQRHRATQANVTALNRQLHYAYDATKPQTLEQAMLIDWETIALRLLDRLRSPTDAPLSPLVVRLRQLPAFADSLARLDCPLDVRRQLAAVSIRHLPPPAHAA